MNRRRHTRSRSRRTSSSTEGAFRRFPVTRREGLGVFLRDFETFRRRSTRRRRGRASDDADAQHRHPTAGVQQQKTIKLRTKPSYGSTSRRSRRSGRLTENTGRCSSTRLYLLKVKTPLLLAQKEIASLQKELDGFRKAVDAKAKEKGTRWSARNLRSGDGEGRDERLGQTAASHGADVVASRRWRRARDASAGTPSS